MTLLSQKTCENEAKKLFSVNDIFQNLKQKEHRYIITEKINLICEDDNQREKACKDREDHNNDFKKNEKLRKDDEDDCNDKESKSRIRSFEHLFRKCHECDEEKHKSYEYSKVSKENKKEKDAKNLFESENIKNIENSLKQTSNSFIKMLKII